MKYGVKYLLFIGLICLADLLQAKTYYISSSVGSDSYSNTQACNPSTPWKSLDKVNSVFYELNSGDSILFKRGDVFYGTIKVAKSGSVFAPIFLGAYGKGNRPQINGFLTLTSWKALGNGVYESSCSGNGSMLVINGTQQAMGRYPNNGYLTFESHSGNSSITDNELTGATNWTGAEVVIKKTRWIIDRNTITAHSGNTLNYDAGNTTYQPTNGYGYFIQNSPKTLDQFGEWYYDASQHKMSVYFGSKNPNNYVVKTSMANNLVGFRNYSYITFDNLAFVGAGKSTFNLVQAKKITLNNCNIDQSGTEGLWGSYSPFLTINNCIINHSMSGGVNIDVGCTNAIIKQNTIKNIGLMPGMGRSNAGTYEAITSFGDNALIERNRIDSIGYNGIYFGGNTSVVKNNYITFFCLTKDDGAGIYIGDWSKTVNKKVIGNIVLHGVGNSEGTNYVKSLQAEGIYIDDKTESVAITDNTVSLCANNGIKVHNAKDINIFKNTVFNNGVQLRMEQDHYIASSTYIRNNNVRNNTFFSKNSYQAVAKFSTHQDDINSFGQLDSNYYNKPKSSLSAIKATTVINGRNVNSNYNLVNWKSVSGKDRASTEVQTNNVLFEYNATNESKTITLKQTYVDVHHKTYKDKVIIKPYSSVLLLAGNDISMRSSY